MKITTKISLFLSLTLLLLAFSTSSCSKTELNDFDDLEVLDADKSLRDIDTRGDDDDTYNGDDNSSDDEGDDVITDDEDEEEEGDDVITDDEDDEEEEADKNR